MAIQKTITNEQGVTSEAYIMVASYNFDKINKSLQFDVFAFYNKEARDNRMQPIQVWHYNLNEELYGQWITSANEQECIYLYIKTLPEFEGAQDLI